MSNYLLPSVSVSVSVTVSVSVSTASIKQSLMYCIRYR